MLQAAWTVEGPAFIVCDKSMADGLLQIGMGSGCPQKGLRMLQLMFGLDVGENL